MPHSKQHDDKALPTGSLVFTAMLLVVIPFVPLVLWDTAVNREGSYVRFYQDRIEPHGLLVGFRNLWTEAGVCTPFSLTIIFAFAAWSLLLMWLIPGKEVHGPVTPHGNVPKYKDNGFACYVLTMAAFCVLTLVLKRHGLSPSVVYDHFQEIIVSLNVISLVFCLFLYLKGLYMPSSTDSGSSNWFLFDYYWGTELYPRVFGFDVKVFTNCRFGLMAWALLICCFAIKSYELHGYRDCVMVTTVLQLIYLTKFYWWEAGYYNTIDIILDRAGFYICWGCLVFVPTLYTSASLYVAANPLDLGHGLEVALLAGGLGFIAINYWADQQKQEVRKSGGKCLIWGKKPLLMRAKYRLNNGETRENLLLASGFWGLSRHFHYLPEIGLSFCWCATTGFSSLMPFTYVIFLTILLFHRSLRDEQKCTQKYGEYWQQYKKMVPYRIVPFIY